MKRFLQFYIDNIEKLFGYLLRKSGSEVLAADLAQESFVRYLERYRKKENNPALLFTIGRNLFYDHSRKQTNSFLHQPHLELIEASRRSQGNTEELYEARQQKKRMQEAIEQLSEDEQDILALVVSSDLKYRDIAQIKGCSEAAVKVTVHRARKKIKTFLREWDNE
jgi:RNA polymerase sigma-70 factor, ECF subfamily